MSNYRNSRYPASEHVPIDALHTPSNRIVKVCSAPDCETEDGDFVVWPCPTVRAVQDKINAMHDKVETIA